MKHRLLEFLEYKGLGKTQFEKACGLSNGYINSMKHYIGPKKLDQILATFPELNRVWLESGVGSMIKGGNMINISNSGSMSNSGNMHFSDIEQLKKKDNIFKTKTDKKCQRRKNIINFNNLRTTDNTQHKTQSDMI